MLALAAPIITWSTLIKLVVGALAAGVGVTVSFSLLIYCADRAAQLRRADRPAAAGLFQAAVAMAVLATAAIIAYGLILTVSKPK